MAIVDSLSAPDSGTTFSCNADFHIILTWTTEDLKSVIVMPRYANWNSRLEVACRSDAGDRLILYYHDGSPHEVANIEDVFTDAQAYQVDIYGNGTNIKIDVGSVEQINETVTYNATQTGGRIDHNLDTNDIELESWPYGEPTAGIALTATIAAVTKVSGPMV